MIYKYVEKGAYHWVQSQRSLFKMNAQLRTRYDIALELLMNEGISKSSAFLEVGCGDGALLYEVAIASGCYAYGLDADWQGILLAKRKFIAKGKAAGFVQAGGNHYPFPRNTFNYILCADVIEHVQDPIRLLEEIRRILRMNGVLVVSTPIRVTEEPLDRHHVQEWFPNEFESLCSKVFGKAKSVVLSHPILPWQIYRYNKKIIRPLIRMLINVLYLAKINPFYTKGPIKKENIYGMQTLVFQKDNLLC